MIYKWEKTDDKKNGSRDKKARRNRTVSPFMCKEPAQEKYGSEEQGYDRFEYGKEQFVLEQFDYLFHAFILKKE